ncbi:MAG TPA: nucleotide pyrophosphohydrolase [Gemmataceae bacterium]|nr:nucleotide pyrophosphohydrolase [Gemmataceae bacterium]
MADSTTTIATLREAARRFNDERNWEQFHSPKNLAMGMACEAAEIMEHFLWLDAEQSRQAMRDPVKLAAVGEEVADVAVYLLNMANVLGLDLSDTIAAKMVKNAIKYPPPGEPGA